MPTKKELPQLNEAALFFAGYLSLVNQLLNDQLRYFLVDR